MTASDDPAFLSAPAVARNSVGPLVTGEDALGSKEEYPVVINEGDSLDAPESTLHCDQQQLKDMSSTDFGLCSVLFASQ